MRRTLRRAFACGAALALTLTLSMPSVLAAKKPIIIVVGDGGTCETVDLSDGTPVIVCGHPD